MTQLTIDTEQLEQLIVQQLPTLIQQNPKIQEVVLELARQSFAERQETHDRFDQILEELRRDREEQRLKWQEYLQEKKEQNRKWEEQNRKWEEYNEEQNRKWDEQNRKWDEQNRKWDEQNCKWKEYNEEQNRKWDEQNRKWDETKQEFHKVHEAIMAMAKKHDRSISALGARWGLKSERAFRHALAGILEESFGIQVLNVIDYDDEGIVFGHPDQIELDVIIKNGLLIICELKSSMSRSDVYMFERKVRFYEKRHQRQANRILIISPMFEAKAQKIADKLGIEVFDDALDVKKL